MGSNTLKRAVFLDRDGVLTRSLLRDGRPVAPRRFEEMEIIPEAPAVLAALKAQGYLLIVITNQPDIARGLETMAELEAMHAALLSALPLDEIRVCPHDDADRCDCRKPKPGLLLAAAQAHSIDLARSFFIGDRWRDVEAGHRAGCTTVQIDYGYDERDPDPPAHARVASLAEAARWVLDRLSMIP